MKKNKGFTLVSLLITLIIVFFLGTLVYKNIKNGSKKDNDLSETVFKDNISKYNSEISSYTLNKQSSDQSFKKYNINADIWDGSNNVFNTIKLYINSIDEENGLKFEIRDGELIYVGDNDNEIAWSKEAGITTDSVIRFNDSVYSDEAEFYQQCLNSLGYKNQNGNELTINGYFGTDSVFALNAFLSDNKYSGFSVKAKQFLISEASKVSYASYPNGMTDNTIKHLSFYYETLYNIDSKMDSFYSINALKGMTHLVIGEPGSISYSARYIAHSIKDNTKIFGYVNLGPNNPTDDKSSWKQADLNVIKSQIDNIANSGWHGVFIDQCGYDWNETRARQNEIIDYAHSKNLSVLANSWNPDDVLGNIINSANPTGEASHLNSNDWYLVESFITDGSSYRADTNYINKYLKSTEYHKNLGVNITTISYKISSKTIQESKEDVKLANILAKSLNFQGYWFHQISGNQINYAEDPDIDLGTFTKYLTFVSGTKYQAETDKYIITYNADSINPTINLTAK